MDINWKWSISGCVAAMYCINSEAKKSFAWTIYLQFCLQLSL